MIKQEQHTEIKTSSSYLYLVCLVAALGGFLFGFDTAVISGTISLVTRDFGLNAISEGWFVSCALLGCIIGVIISGKLSDKFGRKIVLILSAFLFLTSALGCMYAGDFSNWRNRNWRGLNGFSTLHFRICSIKTQGNHGILISAGFNHWYCYSLFY